MTTAIGPGISFMEMLQLTLKNHRQPSPFSPQIMAAIFWEETLFANIPQLGGGRGVGFGQVERQNFFWLTQPRAVQFGYAVPGVMPAMTVLDDDRAVQVSSCILLHLFHHPDAAKSVDKKRFAYEAYAGVRQAAGTPLSAEKRRAIIAGWEACEKDLLELPFSEFTIVNCLDSIQTLENGIITALKKARSFDENLAVKRLRNGKAENVTIRDLLFPRYWTFPAIDRLGISSFLATGTRVQEGSQGSLVQLLQKMLNAQPAPPAPQLATDGAFGPKTKAVVQAFQSQQGLVADGVVGHKTRSALA